MTGAQAGFDAEAVTGLVNRALGRDSAIPELAESVATITGLTEAYGHLAKVVDPDRVRIGSRARFDHAIESGAHLVTGGYDAGDPMDAHYHARALGRQVRELHQAWTDQNPPPAP
ncbi:hypothetical protein OG897_40675 [Streptomyces sp. NBC_00237]|uniref:hypothetical protein n=1 Tax=Streptomyces sp. NBC_00237 TaxID=2975687 RepID=UPI002259897B|nr:hypothetical protein [Streptomyces sp. NBC_00237]MCX5207700.1 hypothetical protein [Streptomyces sp. NBC_00237]